jgi:hypothetical protein
MSLKTQLKKLLNISHIDHKTGILNVSDLKEAHAYCKVNKLSGGLSGTLIENFIRERYNMTKNKSSLCIGDLKHNGENIEVKISNGGQCNNKFNYVQIRLNHNCSYLLTAYHISKENIHELGELFIFKLTKENIKNLIVKHGHYSHGSKSVLGKISKKDLNNCKNNKEYSLRTRKGDIVWKSLMKFRVVDIL